MESVGKTLELSRQREVRISDVDGRGPTDAATLEVAIEAATRLLNDILRGLTSAGMRAANANAVLARPAGVIEGEDLILTGAVRRIEASAFELFLKEGITPVVSPLGYDVGGGCFRLNADKVAVAVAEAVAADKILYLTAHKADELEGAFDAGSFYRGSRAAA